MEATIIIRRTLSIVGQGNGYLQHYARTHEQSSELAQLQSNLMLLPTYTEEGKIGKMIDTRKFHSILQNLSIELGNVVSGTSVNDLRHLIN